MKRSMLGPQGQSSPSSNKRPRLSQIQIQNQDDFQEVFRQRLRISDFPTEPPKLVPPEENFARAPRPSKAEKEIERLLGLDAQASPLFPQQTDERDRSEIPKEFMAELKRKYQRGEFDGKVLNYYAEVLPRGDSTNVPGQGGRAMLLKSIMRQEDTLPVALVAGPAWRPVGVLGKGGFGEVMLWERTGTKGPPIRIATKESRPHDFFKDYCSEAHLTRRLNDLGCKNVIHVVEWAYIEEKFWRNEMGKISRSEPRHRICYEYADYGDLCDLIIWYYKNRLILPEAFLWHVFHSMANALCYCRYGTNKPSPDNLRSWDTIVHMDIKPENMLLATPDLDMHRLYPCVKLADFGLAFTMGLNVREIRYFKSAGPSMGTEGYVPPEVIDKTPEREHRRRHPHELIGSHSDVYSLSMAMENATTLLGLQLELLDETTAQPNNNARPKLEFVYTSDLWNLIFSCQSEDARARPKIQHLYKETKTRMEYYRARAQVEEEAALGNGIPDCFHSNVLYKRTDRRRFETDPVFRSNYRKANLAPVYELLGPLRPHVQDAMMQSNASFSQGDERLFNAGVGHGAGGGKVFQRKHRGPARGDRKVDKRNKEKTKGVARGIRGLLNKMNIFS